MYDSQFRDFNFSELYDPDLSPRGGPSSSWLYHVAYLTRHGTEHYAGDFADAMRWTLKRVSFECFQQTCGMRPIRWEDWYHEKLYQFVTIFLYGRLFEDGEPVPVDSPKLSSLPSGLAGKNIGYLRGSEPDIDWEKLPEAFPPEEADNQDWFGLLIELTRAGERRVERFNRIVDERIAARERRAAAAAPRRATKQRRGRRSPNELRNQIILSALDEGLSREQVCERLDVKAIPTLASMQKLRVTTWREAWEDPELRQSVQEMISRTIRRHDSKNK